ncbi:uncharacterized protein A4U43_C04F4850 [Asparagus officinalis]|uniref:Uncharacterized protein n=1 Tax=Asparagus officinalis TaxID=4686 RepID=A0A5P1F053_ASPOF|nr:uncharacterized protein A4U43_C04F4850 [Asparagus officinalis]
MRDLEENISVDPFLSDAAKLLPVTAVLDWSTVDTQPCEAAQKENNTYACGPNSHCVDNKTALWEDIIANAMVATSANPMISFKAAKVGPQPIVS